MSDDGQKPIGIDLGTTRTAVAEIVAEEPEIVENSEGDEITESVVQIHDDDEPLIGSQARKTASQYPERTIREVKREMGTEEPIKAGDNAYLPEQISAMILDKVISDAEQRINRDIGEAVITVPAYFGENERAATKAAGEIIGLDVTRLLPEPSAACLSYGLRQEKIEGDGEELVFVYDLGGGTFDASLVDVDYDLNYYETQNTDGINDLGGEDFTDAIVEWLIDVVEEDTDVDVSGDIQQINRLREEAIEAKHVLSSQEEAQINIPFFLEDYNLNIEITRKKFNELTDHMVAQTAEPIDRLFERSEYDIDDVDTVLLIGGASRMASVGDFVTDYFGQEPSREVSPDKAVAHGAAIQAGILSDWIDEKETDYGIANGVVSHVVSKSLGVELHDGTTTHLIESDETIPVRIREETFRTAYEDQQVVKIPVVEGESIAASENEVIGVVKLGEQNKIPPRSPDEDSLAVEFTYNKDGTLEVEAEDLLSEESVDATFEGVGKHSDDEIAKLQQETPGITI